MRKLCGFSKVKSRDAMQGKLGNFRVIKRLFINECAIEMTERSTGKIEVA